MTWPTAFSWQNRTSAVFALSVLLFSATFTRGDDSGLEVHAPWAAAKQVDLKSNELQFVAMTPALDDHSTWLLLACTPVRREVQVYLVAESTFSYPLPSQARLELRLDDRPAISSAADTVEDKLIRLRTPPPRDLALQIDRGRRMAVSIQPLEGQTHDYSFQLQPTELALRDIRAHCLAEGR